MHAAYFNQEKAIFGLCFKNKKKNLTKCSSLTYRCSFLSGALYGSL